MTEQEKEILIITAEECGEVVQAVAKLLRFGKEETAAYNNISRLEEEIGDLWCMIGLLVDRGILDKEAVAVHAVNKRRRLEEYSDIFK